MKIIFLLSKSYLDHFEVQNQLKQICLEYNFSYFDSDDEYLITNNGDIDEGTYQSIRFNIYDEPLFQKTMGSYHVPEYGCMMWIGYKSADDLILVIIKELLKKYPDVLVYTEDCLPDGHSFIALNKENVDSYQGKDAYKLLHFPPQLA